MEEELYVRKCIGCGYCCLKAVCLLGQAHGNVTHPDQRCPYLQWTNHDARYICMLYKKNPQFKDRLHIGAGCCSPLNTYRKEVKERN